MERKNRLFNSIPEAIEAIKEGKFIVVVDDEDRENEGDLIMASEKVTPEAVNFFATHGRGLICVSLTEERIQELKLQKKLFPECGRIPCSM